MSLTDDGKIPLYLLNSFFFKNFVNFLEISLNLTFLFKKRLTNSSLAETKIVSNKEFFWGISFRIFIKGNFCKFTFSKLRLFNLLMIGRKLALSDALKVISKQHQPPFIIKVLLNLFQKPDWCLINK